jgi:hypothetical protein
MATHHKAQLIEAEPPMVEILERMAGGLAPNARQILDSLGYYNEHDWQIPSQGSDLTKQEQQDSIYSASIARSFVLISKMSVKYAMRSRTRLRTSIFRRLKLSAIAWSFTDRLRNVKNMSLISICTRSQNCPMAVTFRRRLVS